MRIYKIGELERKLAMQKRNAVLVSYYRAAQKGIRAELMSLDITDFRRYRIQVALTNVNSILRGLDSKAVEWSGLAIREGYKAGLVDVGAELRRLYPEIRLNFDGPIHTGAIRVLADQTALDLVTANETMRKQVDGFLLRTQQRLVEDSQISKMIADGVIRGEARRTVSDRIYQEFQERLRNEQFILINGRHYRPDYYAEMVARTRTMEASNNAAVNLSLQYGNDLVQVSSHSDACEVCQEFQGRVFSISGTSDDFPPFDTIEVPAHPHCRHVVTPVNEDILRERGEYEGLARFSQSQERIKTFAEYERAIAL